MLAVQAELVLWHAFLADACVAPRLAQERAGRMAGCLPAPNALRSWSAYWGTLTCPRGFFRRGMDSAHRGL